MPALTFDSTGIAQPVPQAAPTPAPKVLTFDQNGVVVPEGTPAPVAAPTPAPALTGTLTGNPADPVTVAPEPAPSKGVGGVLDQEMKNRKDETFVGLYKDEFHELEDSVPKIPYITAPKRSTPEEQAVSDTGAGLVNAAADVANMLDRPSSLALMASTGGLASAAPKLAALAKWGFTGLQIKGLYENIKAIPAALNTEQRAHAIFGSIMSSAMTSGLIFGGGKGELKPATEGELDAIQKQSTAAVGAQPVGEESPGQEGSQGVGQGEQGQETPGAQKEKEEVKPVAPAVAPPPPPEPEPLPEPKLPPGAKEVVNGIASRSRTALASEWGSAGPGAASSEEFMHRYASVGASHLVNSLYDFGAWSREMEQEFGSQIRDQLPEIFERSKQVVNDFQTATAEPEKPAPSKERVSVNSVAAQKESLRAQEKAGEAGVIAGRMGERNRLRPVIAGLKGIIANSITKAQGLGEYLRGMEKGSKVGAAARQQQLALADKWMAADQEKVRATLNEYVNKTLPPKERGRFIGAITRALRRPDLIRGDSNVMYRNAFRVMQAIENRSEEVYRNDAIRDIRDTVNRALDSPTVDLKSKRIIQRLVGSMNLNNPGKETMMRLQATKDYIDQAQAKGKDVLMPEMLMNALDQLGKTPIKELPTRVLENLRNNVILAEKMGRMIIKTRQQFWDAEKKLRMGAMQEGDASPLEKNDLVKPQPGEDLTWRQKLQNRLSKIFNLARAFDLGHMPEDVIFDMAQNGKGTYSGPLFDNVRFPIDGASDAAARRTISAVDPLREIVKKNRLTDKDEDLIGLWAHLQQDGGEERELASGVIQETIDKIKVKGLTPKQDEAYQYMRKTLDSFLPSIQQTMHQLYNIPVEAVKNYFPWMREYEVYKAPPESGVFDPRTGERVSQEELDSFNRIAGNLVGRGTSKLSRGFTLERQEGAATPIRHDSFDVFERHIYNASRLIDMQRTAKMTGEMIRSPEFGEKYGKWSQQLLNEWLTGTVTDGKGNNVHRMPLLDMARRASSRSMVFFRLASNIKHVSAFPQGLANAGTPAHWFRGIHGQFTPEGKAFLSNFPQVTQRQAGDWSYAELQRNLIKDPDKLFTKAMSLADRYGFVLGKEIDSLNSKATFIGRYLYNLDQKGDTRGLSVPVDQGAAYNAMTFMRRTVSSTLQKDVQPVLGRGMGYGGNVSVARTLNAFRQYGMERWSLMRYDIPQAFKSGNYTRGAALTTAVIAAGLYETNIKGALDKGWSTIFGTGETKKPKDTMAERLFLDAITMAPYMNNVVSAAQYGESGIPAVDTAVSTGKAVGQVMAAKSPLSQEKAAISAAEAAAEVFGVPGSGAAAASIKNILVPKKSGSENRRSKNKANDINSPDYNPQ